eukprot:6192309-Pleurochrysis_carterae.AAC.3
MLRSGYPEKREMRSRMRWTTGSPRAPPLSMAVDEVRTRVTEPRTGERAKSEWPSSMMWSHSSKVRNRCKYRMRAVRHARSALASRELLAPRHPMLAVPRLSLSSRRKHHGQARDEGFWRGRADGQRLRVAVDRTRRRRVVSSHARRRARQIDERRQDGALVRQVELHQPLQVRLRARLEAVAQHRLRLRAALPLRGAAFAAGVLVLDGLAAQRLLTDDRVGLVAANALDVARRAALRTRLVCVRLAPTLHNAKHTW